MSSGITISGSQRPEAPRRWRTRLRYLGPGIVLAAAGIGAGDMVTSLSGAAEHGMGLLWVVVVGVVVKFAITEAVGRLHLATGRTPMASIRSAGRWLPWVFLVFLAVIGLVYGAALSSVAALAAKALIPGLPVTPLAIGLALASGALVLVGRYGAFERVMMGFTLLMFVGVIAAAVAMLGAMDNPGDVLATLRPSMPAGSIMTVLALIGGVGGSAGIAAYGYWVREKGWRESGWLPVMRADSAISYLMIVVFVAGLSVLGTGLLYGTGQSIAGTEGLAALADPLGAMLGTVPRLMFLVSFFFVVVSSIVGGFNGLGFLMADCVRVIRGIPEAEADRHMAITSTPFRVVIGYFMAASAVIVFTGKPVGLVLLYALFGSLILPILSGALLYLLNKRSIDSAYRNSLASNIGLSSALVLFAVLGVAQIAEMF
ncbi:Nramp family divalent metal transporter [Saccharopolyspora griseoalba]|uniref:Nramp family divalent metal transporter n=1 Tax=Saccharopolyspora griseoalba TaxID=1431848 RepID=A0ABW2LQJ9_9PSEU